MRTRMVLGTLAATLLLAGVGHADTLRATYHFGQITQNGGPGNAAAIGGAGGILSVDVLEVADPTQVAFKFYWASAFVGSITDIYFDDGELLSIDAPPDGVTYSAGVNFSQGASPGNLPSGGAVNFNTTAGFSADSNPPVQANGVNWASPDNEWVRILFNLQTGSNVDDVLAAIQLALLTPNVDVPGGLRMGLHVQAFADGESQSFVIVPLPPAAWAGLASLTGVFGVGYMRRRSFRA